MIDPWTLLLLAPAAFAVGLTAFNLAVWPRGVPRVPWGRVSALVPARNEADTIETTVRALLAQHPAVYEVVVCDDGSTDATPEILRRLQAEDDRLRVISGVPLPEGWIGKPHACHQLAEAARGDRLVFVDADVTLAPDGIARLLAVSDDLEADLVTAVPRQETGSFTERLVLPLLHLTYTSWLPLPLIWSTQDPRFLAANGQLLAIRRDALAALGGFASIRTEIVDDMALTRRAKAAGLRVGFADGHDMASCRMYGSGDEVWSGFSKNLYEGLGNRPAALVGVMALYFIAFVLPYLALAASPWVPALLWPAGYGVLANVLLRAMLAQRFEQPLLGAVLHPLAVLVLLGIATNSWWWTRKGTLHWAGRTYAPRSARLS